MKTGHNPFNNRLGLRAEIVQNLGKEDHHVVFRWRILPILQFHYSSDILVLGHDVDFVQDTGGGGQLVSEAHFPFLGDFPPCQASDATGPEITFEPLVGQVGTVCVLPFLINKPVAVSKKVFKKRVGIATQDLKQEP